MSTATLNGPARWTAAIRVPRVPAAHWVRSRVWDGFWMFAGIWGSLALFLLSRWLGWHQAATVLFFGNAAIALGHSYSTMFMFLGSSRLRAVRRRRPGRYVAIPWAIGAGAMALGIYVGLTLSFPRSARYGLELWPWLAYLGLFWVGHFFHFAKQDFGVLTLYRSRAGQHDARARRIDAAYTLAMMMAIQPIMYVSVTLSSPLSEAFYSLTPVSPGTMQAIARGAFWVAYLLTLGVVSVEISRVNCSVPKLLYYGIMLAHPAIFYFLRSEVALFYFTTYLWSHWFVAIGLVARLNANHYRLIGYTPRLAHLRHGLIVGAIVFVVWLLFGELEHLRVFSAFDYRQRLAEVTPSQGLFVGLVLGAFLAEQLIHYYCDRHLFRMRDREVREAIGPLL